MTDVLAGALRGRRRRSGASQRSKRPGFGHLERQDRILLVSPPFDENAKPYPGRIADYPPGVRENGGQYTHGATWTVDAFMRLAEQAKA